MCVIARFDTLVCRNDTYFYVTYIEICSGPLNNWTSVNRKGAVRKSSEDVLARNLDRIFAMVGPVMCADGTNATGLTEDRGQLLLDLEVAAERLRSLDPGLFARFVELLAAHIHAGDHSADEKMHEKHF